MLWRWTMLPADPTAARGFSHDSGYLTMTARNLLEGKGYVLDALWLVFLQPASLPLPLHNCNPLQPTLIAALGWVSGMPLAQAAFGVAALASAGLWLASTFLLLRWIPQPLFAALAALGVVLFPPVWRSSFAALTDETWLALAVAFLAFLVRSSRPSMAWWAGAFWALAWLARSTAVLVLAGGLLYLWLAFGWRRMLRWIARAAPVALLLCSPWMLHNHRVWGNPVRSDDSALMSLAAYSVPSLGLPFPRAFHLPDPPASFVSVVIAHPDVVLSKIFSSGRFVLFETLRGAVHERLPLLGLLAVASLTLLWSGARPWKTPEGLSAGAYSALLLGLFLVLGPAFEYRYCVLTYSLFAAWLSASLWLRPSVPGTILGLAVLASVLWVDVEIVQSLRGAGSRQAEFFQAATVINRDITRGEPVIVGPFPYFYSLATRAQALAIPEAGDDYLKRFMRKYGARHIVLSDEERSYWRPAWAAGPPPEFALAGKVGSFAVYRWDPPAGSF